MKHSYDPRTQNARIVWHNDPTMEVFIRHLIETIKPDRWVETGTHMGWTSIWVAENYPNLPIYTIEVDPDYYVSSKENLAPYPQVALSFGSSQDFLRKLLPVLRKGLSIFWLDAHWWPPVPLRDECKVVASLDRYICLLDDFTCWGPDFSGDTFWSLPPCNGEARLNDLSYTADILGQKCYRPDYQSMPGYKGYGLFTKGVNYTPPPSLKVETLPVSLIHERSIQSLREALRT